MAVLKEQRPENNRKRREIGTLCHLKTVTTARLRSKPRNEGQEYLDLWSLKLNRARWAQEQAQERLKAIDHAISKLEFPDGGVPGHERNEAHVNKTIDLGLRSPGGR